MNAVRRKAIHEAMLRLADGDRSAFDVLLDELWPVILAFAERHLGKGADAEDVAQEVFYRICLRIAEFDSSRDALSWAFGIAHYEVLTLRRKRQRRREVYDEAALAERADPGDSQEGLLLHRELVLAFEQIVGALTEDDRHALGLVASAQPASATSATFRKRKQRAMERLRGLWRNFQW